MIQKYSPIRLIINEVIAALKFTAYFIFKNIYTCQLIINRIIIIIKPKKELYATFNMFLRLNIMYIILPFPPLCSGRQGHRDEFYQGWGTPLFGDSIPKGEGGCQKWGKVVMGWEKEGMELAELEKIMPRIPLLWTLYPQYIHISISNCINLLFSMRHTLWF